MHKTRSPDWAKAVAIPAQTDVFPVPPLPDRTARTSPNRLVPPIIVCVHYKANSHKNQEKTPSQSNNFHHNPQKPPLSMETSGNIHKHTFPCQKKVAKAVAVVYNDNCKNTGISPE
jgi:hypothetical protein